MGILTKSSYLKKNLEYDIHSFIDTGGTQVYSKRRKPSGEEISTLHATVQNPLCLKGKINISCRSVMQQNRSTCKKKAYYFKTYCEYTNFRS